MLNPFGGRGLAPRKWEEAKQLFDHCHIDVQLKHTERAGHAFDIGKDELKPGDYDGIITISGDGLIHELVNGIMSRPDRQELFDSLTLGFIPAGTGNGLIKSITH